MRVVSLTCSNTEIVCALGCSEFLVGVDNHSDYPVEVVTRLPRVGPDLQIDIAKVQSLAPDLVLASLTVPGHERIVQGLEQAKLPFLAPEPCFLRDVYADIQQIGAALGVPERARELVNQMQMLIAAGPSPSAESARRPRLLVEWWPKPVIVPGRMSWVTDLIQTAGGYNPLAARDVKSTPISDAEAAELRPDAIIVSWCGVRPEKYRLDVVERRTAWADLPALRQRRIFAIPEAYLGRPGPRLVNGFQALRRIVADLSSRSLNR